MKHNIIQHLFLFITNRCNGNCKFCFNWRNINTEDNNKNEILSLEEISLISKSLKGLKTLSISGGEPFLRGDIVDVCKVFYINTHLKAISIPTNGLLPETISKFVEEIVSYCKRSLIVIELPLDGVYGHFDEIRGIKGGFDKMKDSFFRLKSIAQNYKNLHVKFNITYLSYNKNSIIEILDTAKSIFGADIDFTLCSIHGNPRYKEAKEINIQDYFNILNEINNSYNRRGIKNLIFNAIHKTVDIEFKKRLLEKKASFKCLAGESFIVLFHNGNIYPCEPLFNICLGNIRKFDYNLANAISKESLSYQLLKTSHQDACICDWICGISRSMWSSKIFFFEVLYQLSKDILNFLWKSNSKSESELRYNYVQK